MGTGNGKIDNRGQQRAMIPRPGVEAFEGGMKNITEHLMQAPQPVFIFERAEYPESGGIFVYLRDVKYPTKGFPTPEACQAANIVKRAYVGQLRFFTKNMIAATTLLRRKNLEQWLDSMGSMAEIALGPYYLKPIRYNRACRQMRIFVETFMKSMGISDVQSERTAKVFATIFEYDNAYLLRLQDVANETDVDRLRTDFRGELLRLYGIFLQREGRPKIQEMFKNVLKLLTFVFYFPKVKRALMKALNAIDFSEMQMDEGDRYHVLRWMGYDFFGQSFEERASKFFAIHGGVAPRGFIMQTDPGGVNLHE